MSSINWGDLVKDAGESSSGNYEPLPDGEYELKVIEAKATVSQSGKTMFKITTEVQGGPFAKRRIWDNLVISPENKNALGIFFSKMAALGVPREFFMNNNPSNAQVEATILDKTFRATIGKRTWNNDVKNEIKKYHVGVATSPAPQAVAASAPVAPPAPPAPPVAPVATSAPTDAPF
jgi:hypothetical protein